MKHEIGPALRTTTIHMAYVVYKDYDNLPPGPVFATCATITLAKEVLEIINKAYEATHHNQNDTPHPYITHGIDWIRVPWPTIDGHETSAYWNIMAHDVERCQIATTLDEAMAQIPRPD